MICFNLLNILRFYKFSSSPIELEIIFFMNMVKILIKNFFKSYDRCGRETRGQENST